MTKMMIESIDIINFKGIKSLTVNLSAQGVVISGRNASGKSTVADAIMWLLTDKDSQQRGQFGIKPIDADGQEIHGVETSVSANVNIDGIRHTLCKKQRELWTRPKGRPEAVFSGNETEYIIDDIPMKKAEFSKFAADICPPDLIPLLMLPAAFNALNNAARRKALVEYLGAGADVPMTGEFAAVPDLLNGGTLADARKRLKAQRDRASKELDILPARVDEASQQITDEVENAEEIESQINALAAQIDAVTAQIGSMQNQSPEAAKAAELAALKAQLNSMRRTRTDALVSAMGKYHDAVDELTAYTGETERTAARIKSIADKIEQEAAHVESLRVEWKAEHGKQFESGVPMVCPTCGQMLPPDKIEAAQASALATFESEKARACELIRKQGVEARKALELLTESKGEAESALKRIEGKIEALRAKKAEMDKMVQSLSVVTVEETELEKRILTTEKESVEPVTASDLPAKKAELSGQMAAMRQKLYAVHKNADAKARVNELMRQRRETGALVAKLDNDMALLDEYQVALCRSLEERVNAPFTLVQWKLFDQYDNGNLKDACICTIGGVPYEYANTAAKVNAGLEIAQVLGDAAGINLPVIVDNAEGVNRIADSDRQKIILKVTNDDLKMEEI